MTEPTVHLNGTGHEALRRQYQAAYFTLAPAIEALQQTTPHGGDYYPQDGGRINGSVYQAARAEHAERLRRLEEVRPESGNGWVGLAPWCWLGALSRCGRGWAECRSSGGPRLRANHEWRQGHDRLRSETASIMEEPGFPRQSRFRRLRVLIARGYSALGEITDDGSGADSLWHAGQDGLDVAVCRLGSRRARWSDRRAAVGSAADQPCVATTEELPSDVAAAIEGEA